MKLSRKERKAKRKRRAAWEKNVLKRFLLQNRLPKGWAVIFPGRWKVIKDEL